MGNRLRVLEYLLEVEPKINVNPVDRFGGTPLEDAYRHNNKPAIQALTAAGGLRKDDPSQGQAFAKQMADLKAEKKERRQPVIAKMVATCSEKKAAEYIVSQLIPKAEE